MTIGSDRNPDIKRAKRVQRLKKLIVIGFLAAILVPCVLCVILGYQLFRTNRELGRQQEKIAELEQSMVKAQGEEGVFSTSVITEGRKAKAPEQEAKEYPEAKEQRRVYLTFDDGPSSNTEEILDILRQYDVKATFFVVGKEEERYREAYTRIVNEGHTLGMHSYSHKYDELYQSIDSFKKDLNKLQEFLYDRTGVWPRHYRFPGGSSNTVSKANMYDLIGYLNSEDIMYYDWNVESGDTVNGKTGADGLVKNCMDMIRENKDAIVLMHDAADKSNTVKALPILIGKVRELENTVLLPITDDTIPIQHLTNETD